MGVIPTEEVLGLLSLQDGLELGGILQRTPDVFSGYRLLQGFALLLHIPLPLDRIAV